MLFKLVRIILLALLCFLSFHIVLRSKISKKKLATTMAIVASFVVITATGMFPPENAFITFETPKAVFDYYQIGDFEAVIEGENSALVYYNTDAHTHGFCIIPKSLSGYKIPNHFFRQRYAHKLYPAGVFDIYRARNTNDYYILAIITSDTSERMQVFDKNGQLVETYGEHIGDGYAQVTYVHNFSSGFYTIIAGEVLILG